MVFKWRDSGWNPWAELREMQRAFDSLAGSDPLEMFRGGTFPPVNVSMTNDEILVTAEVPGVKLEKIDLSVTGDSLTIQGCRGTEPEGAGEFHRRERPFGEFGRVIHLPDRVQGDKATASYKNGILTVKIPKAPEAQTRKISVKGE